MSTARGALTVVGQVVGAYFGPVGSAIGGAIGGYIGGEIDGPQKGPRLDDTAAPMVEFGGKTSRVYGRVWCTLSPLWWSGLRESEVNSGGKGAADQTVDNYVYHCDMLGRLADGSNVIAWTRMRINGKIVATQLADSSDESLAATASTEMWSDIELRTGAATQTPWSVMEAAEGAGNVSAYRDQCTFAFTNLLMENGRNPSLIEVEVITKGTQSGAKTRLQSYFDENDSTDISAFANGPGTLDSSGTSYITLIDNRLVVRRSDPVNVSLTYEDETLAADGVSPILFELFASWEGTPNVAYTVLATYIPNSADPGYFRIGYYGATGQICFDFSGDFGTEFVTAEPVLGRALLSVQMGGAGSGFYINRVLVHTFGTGILPSAGANTGKVILGPYTGVLYPPDVAGYSIDEFRLRFNDGDASDLSPTDTLPPPDGLAWTPDTEDLQDVLEAEMLRCSPLTSAHIDMSAAAGKEVWGFKASRSAAAECGVLLDWYYLDIFCGDKITVVERGGAVEQTIPYGYTGSGVDGTSEPFAGLIRGADVESQFATAVQYINILADGEVDTQQGQRVGTGSEVHAVNFSIYSKASFAKGRADTITHDTRVAAHTATVRLGAKQAASIQPASVLRLVDNKGNSYRSRALRLVWNRGVYELDVCLDDPNILKTVGITTEVDTSVIEVAPPATTEALLLDGPNFRDVDDDPGFYAFAEGSPQGSLLFDGDNAKVVDFTAQSVFGTCSTVLGDWTGGWVFDESNSVTVNVGAGQLSSTTRAALIADEAVNLCAIGAHGRWEICQFRTAPMLSAGVHMLSGLLRGQFGTEWAIPLHEAGDKFVLITTAGRRIEDQANEIGIEETYTAVTKGRSLESGTTQAFTNNAVGKKPRAPVHLRKSILDSATSVGWTPRTRYATRFASSLGIYAPIGETTESYDVELRNASDVLVSTDTVTTPTWTASGIEESGGLVAPCWGIKIIGGELVAIRDDQVGVYTTPKSFIRFDTSGAQLGVSPVLGQEVYQWANDGDELYAVTADFNNTTPTTYNNSKVQRVTRTAIGTVAATYTAGTAGDLAGIACDGTSVWVTERVSGNLRELDASTLASVATYAINAGITALQHLSGSLWIVSNDTSEVIEWDIATTTELQRFAVVSAPCDLLIVGSLLFVQGAYAVGVYDLSGVLQASHTLSAPMNLPQRSLHEFGSYVTAAGLTDVTLLDSTTGDAAVTVSPDASYFFNVAGASGSTLYLSTGGAGLSAQTVGYALGALDLTGYSVTVYQNGLIGRGYPATLEL